MICYNSWRSSTPTSALLCCDFYLSCSNDLSSLGANLIAFVRLFYCCFCWGAGTAAFGYGA